jgi:hypothetical protein
VTFLIFYLRLEAKFGTQKHRFTLVETGPKTQDCRPLEVKFVQKYYHRRDRLAPIAFAMRVATDRISHEALPASFQDFSPHRAREYIVNSRDAAMSAIWYAIREA